MRYQIPFLALIGMTLHNGVLAQGNVEVKINLFYGVYTYTPNLKNEIGLGHHMTLDLM